MFETIVWATDGSDLADRALPLVAELARTFGSKVVAIHANAVLPARFGGAPMLADEEDVVAKVGRQVSELRDAGLNADLKVETGIRPGVAGLIVAAANDAGAGLIVVGTHGRNVAAAALLGSVARDLLHRASCPVLVVTPESEPAATAASETQVAV